LRATFQTPPSVAEERGWSAEGTSVPAAICDLESLWGRADKRRRKAV
jgi:hypothetical protein